jgi:hypothetical protein
VPHRLKEGCETCYSPSRSKKVEEEEEKEDLEKRDWG